MIEDVYQRSKLLSRTCIKIALVLPPEKSLCHLARSYLIDCATTMAIAAKGLSASNNKEYFFNTLSKAKEAADGVNYWLEMIQEESCLDPVIIDPILEESDSLSLLYSAALKTVRPKQY